MKTIAFVSLFAAVAAYGQTPVTPGTSVPPADSFNSALSIVEDQMLSLVKAMPAEKYGFAPSAALFSPAQATEFGGVKTFRSLAIHVAQANYALAGPMAGMKPDVDMASLSKLQTKEEIVAAMTASFRFVHQAIGTLTVENAFQSIRGPVTRATQVSLVMAHTADEYGQMVEYARMNGLVPPASQKK